MRGGGIRHSAGGYPSVKMISAIYPARKDNDGS
ncbi:hypothetical protein ABIA30_003896 [Mycobacterium sp. MAA66]